jgi:nanoRNase/pAp phosphatase (c-di-AMP/oligoRNAs hydrolase)
MALRDAQQIFEAIKRSQRPLVCVAKGSGIDGHASALGVARVMERLDKQPVIVSSDGKPNAIQFLADHTRIQDAIENLQRFTIELDAAKTQVKELSYELKNDKLFVYLSPKKGRWDPQDVRLSPGQYHYDLIVSIGAADLEGCAPFYTEHPDFFFHTPILNIDHSPANEHFGQFNAVDVSAVACGEVCHDLLEAMEPGLIDEETATAFLTGLIAKTHSFKQRHVNARTLETASKLMAHGARRDLIVQHLYRTRSVSTLRLWGRALARLKVNAEKTMVWTLLSQQDFLHAGAQEQDLPDVIDELISSSPEASIAVLIFENSKRQVEAIVRVGPKQNALTLTQSLHPEGSREQVRLLFPTKPIVEAEKMLVEILQNKSSEEILR